MIVILISIIAAVIAGAALLKYGNSGFEDRNFAALLCGLALLLASGLSAVAYSFMAWSWIAADSKAKIINREYGTNYTREEVFYASDVINTIREIDRKRIEVNGDLMRGGKRPERELTGE